MAETRSQSPFNRVTQPDGSPLRDKDNAAPEPKPSNQNLKPRPNLAPAGAMGIKTNLPRKPNPLVPGLRPGTKIFKGFNHHAKVTNDHDIDR